MRGIVVIVLHTVLVGVYAQAPVANGNSSSTKNFADVLMDKLVDKLADKFFLKNPSRFWAAPSGFPQRARNPNIANAVKKQALRARPVQAENSFAAKVLSNPIAEWPAKYRSLWDQGLKAVTPQMALKMMQSPFFPAKLVDVRLESEFATSHSQGAINVPLFRELQGKSAFDWSKRLVNAALGVQSTERNPEFEIEALKQLNRDTPIIIVCNRGGNDADKIFDQPRDWKLNQYTASLKAASELYEAGFKKLFFLKDGFTAWDREGLPLVEGAR